MARSATAPASPGHWMLSDSTPLVEPCIAPVARARREDMQPPGALAEGVHSEDGARVGPDVCIGARGTVGTGARVQGSILWEDVTVEPGASIEDCILGAGVTVGAGCKHIGEVLVR